MKQETSSTPFIGARADLVRMAREVRDLRDAAILDRNADRLNREAADVLEYQGLPD